jgi:hypothetical protein
MISDVFFAVLKSVSHRTKPDRSCTASACGFSKKIVHLEPGAVVLFSTQCYVSLGVCVSVPARLTDCKHKRQRQGTAERLACRAVPSSDELQVCMQPASRSQRGSYQQACTVTPLLGLPGSQLQLQVDRLAQLQDGGTLSAGVD